MSAVPNRGLTRGNMRGGNKRGSIVATNGGLATLIGQSSTTTEQFAAPLDNEDDMDFDDLDINAEFVDSYPEFKMPEETSGFYEKPELDEKDEKYAVPERVWEEYRSVSDPSKKIFYDHESKEAYTDRIPTDDERAGIKVINLKTTDYDGVDSRLHESVDLVQKQIDFLDAHSSQISSEFSEIIQNIRKNIALAVTALEEARESNNVDETNSLDFLIGYRKLNWQFENNPAIDYYRVCSRQTNHAELAFHNWHFPEYFSEQPLPVPSTTDNNKDNCHVTFGFENTLKTAKFTFEPNQTVGQLYQEICKKISKNSPAYGHEHEYVLKVTGQSEYFDNEKPLFSYAHVRKCLRDGNKVEFTVVRRPEPNITPELQELTNNLVATYQSKIRDDIFPLDKFTFTNINPHTTWRDYDYIPMTSLNVPIRIRLIGIDKCSVDTLPRLDSNITCAFLRVVLFHGNSHIARVFDTPSQECEDVSTIRFSERYVSQSITGNLHDSITISRIPRESRIGFILIGKKDGETQKEIPLAWAVQQCVTQEGHLVTGRIQYRLWAFPSKDGKKHGKKRDVDPQFIFRASTVENHSSAVKSAVLTVEFDSYGRPVVAPLVDIYREPNLRIVGQELDVRKKRLDKNTSRILLDSISADPLYEFTPEMRKLFWDARHYLVDIPSALPRVLQCVDWGHQDYKNEAHRLLRLWAHPASYINIIELLDSRYADYTVREYAVNLLKNVSDDELQLFLLQLVQAIKFEPYHDSPLSRFLIERAIRSPLQIGHSLYWHLKAEVHDPLYCERFTCILEEFLSNCGPFAQELARQLSAVQRLQKVAELIVHLKRDLQYSDADATVEYQKELERLNNDFFLPMGKFQVPLLPKIEATSLVVEKCRYMSSKMVPLFLVFKNADPHGADAYVIFKSGDDLRQDLLTLQLLRVMDKMWLSHNIDLRLKPYSCLATGVNADGEGVGMIEVVKYSDTTSSIQLKYGGGAMGALKLDPIDLYIREHNRDEKTHLRAVDNFVRSCAGYCVATFVLGIGDRHNGNIMVTQSGHLFHIDFGHFLGNFKKKFGVNRERAAFVFTPEMAYVMGGKGYKKHKMFKIFNQLCFRAFKVLRANAALLETLFMLMVVAGMPELMKEVDIRYLRDKLYLSLDPKSASKELQFEINKSLDSTYRRIDNYIHNLRHG